MEPPATLATPRREPPKLDHRNYTILTDIERREFLANLEPKQEHAYSVAYQIAFRRLKRYGPWINVIRLLDRKLVLSGARGGRRSDQIVEGLKAENARVGILAGVQPYTPTPSVENGAKPQEAHRLGWKK